MSQTGYTPISLYYSATASAAPAAGNLVAGELALNTNDGKLFYKDSSGVVQTLATKSSASGSFTTLSASSTVTFSGGTANGVAYLNGSKVLTTGSALTFDGANLTLGGGYMSLNGNGYFRTDIAGYLAMQAGSTGYVWRSTGNAGDWMTLTSTGLGIGTSSPSVKLDVAGTAYVADVTTGNKTFYVGPATPADNSSSYIHLLSSNTQKNWRIATNQTVAGAFEIQQSSAIGGNTFSSSLMMLDTSGNLGLGVTPSAWQSGRKAFQVGYSSMNSYSNSQIQLGANFYYDGTNNKYITTDYSTVYQQINGQHQWYNAASGTAGNAITFTQAMTLDASGNLLIGETSATLSSAGRGLIEINGSANALLALNVGGANYSYLYQNGTDMSLWNTKNGYMRFGTNGNEAARIDSSGNLGIGTTSPNASAILDAQSTTKGVRFPNMTGTQKNAISSPAAGLVVFDTTLAKLCVYSGSAWQTITSI